MVNPSAEVGRKASHCPASEMAAGRTTNDPLSIPDPPPLFEHVPYPLIKRKEDTPKSLVLFDLICP